MEEFCSIMIESKAGLIFNFVLNLNIKYNCAAHPKSISSEIQIIRYPSNKSVLNAAA